ncbi:oxidoreductase [Millisia brevis]|uniref:oxidoreductase n=1 Tax=Millisia brevis TaxID=264148 RepID=UPI000836786A|nr:oxidoreductase [Millisia brevis]
MTVPASDPLYALVSAPGIVDAAERARSALAAVHRHRFNLRGWSRSAAIAGSRAARASDLLAAAEQPGGAGSVPSWSDPQEVPTTPAIAVATALGVDAIDTTVATWRRAPLQVLARLHVLAAGADADPASVGRPRSTAVARRLDLLAQLLTGATAAPAPIVTAIAHAELLSLRPFGSHDGVVARGAARLTAIASGLDPHGLGVPEIEWMRRPGDYRTALTAYAEGSPEAVLEWVEMCCRAMEAGAAEAVKIADSLASG